MPPSGKKATVEVESLGFGQVGIRCEGLPVTMGWALGLVNAATKEWGKEAAWSVRLGHKCKKCGEGCYCSNNGWGKCQHECYPTETPAEMGWLTARVVALENKMQEICDEKKRTKGPRRW